MSGLPTQIPQQSVPICGENEGKPQFMNINWYLWAYNISLQVLGTSNSGGGTTPASPYDLLDAENLYAQTSDIPGAYTGLENLGVLLQSVEQPNGVDIARLQQQLDSVLVLAALAPIPDAAPHAQPAQTVTVGASPFVYRALADGLLSITSGTVSAVAIIRQTVSVATGLTSGLVPVRRGDQVQITYSVVPTVVFLPN
jgi:hypothetical protein